MNDKLKNFRAGIQAEIPLLIGVFPFGLIYGATALNAGISPVASQMMSSIVFAGSAQIITAQLVHDVTPGVVIVLTIAVVNLRHMLYSASLAPYIASLPPRWKVLHRLRLKSTTTPAAEAGALPAIRRNTASVKTAGHARTVQPPDIFM